MVEDQLHRPPVRAYLLGVQDHHAVQRDRVVFDRALLPRERARQVLELHLVVEEIRPRRPVVRHPPSLVADELEGVRRVPPERERRVDRPQLRPRVQLPVARVHDVPALVEPLRVPSLHRRALQVEVVRRRRPVHKVPPRSVGHRRSVRVDDLEGRLEEVVDGVKQERADALSPSHPSPSFPDFRGCPEVGSHACEGERRRRGGPPFEGWRATDGRA